MEEKKTYIQASKLWVWCVPMMLLLSAGMIGLLGKNQELFFFFNNFSQFTGQTLWAGLTILGDGLIAFVLLFPFIYRKPHFIWAVLIGALLFTVFGQTLKHLTNLPRPPSVFSPEDFVLIGPKLGYNSFPSGHSAMIFNLIGVFALSASRKWLRILLIGIGLLIAASRMVVGVHWPADVLAGAAFGWIAVWAGLKSASAVSRVWDGWGKKVLGAVLLSGCIVLFFSNYTEYPGVTFFQRTIAILSFFLGGYEYLRVWGCKIPLHASRRRS